MKTNLSLSKNNFRFIALMNMFLLCSILISTFTVNGQTQVWQALYNGSANGDDTYTTMTVDVNGNVYVTGTSSNGSNGDYATIKYNSNGVQQWIAIYNGTGNGYDQPVGIALDGSGNVYITGFSFNGSNYDFATIKYDNNGNQQWVSIYDGPTHNDDKPIGLKVDGSGNVYVAGATFNGNDDDFATVKYNTNGVQQWAVTYDGGANSGDYINALTIDGNGNVYVVGDSYNGSDYDYLTVKYNTNGVQQWASRYSGPVNDYSKAIALDLNGNVFVTGTSYTGFSYVGPYTECATLKYDNNGVLQWGVKWHGAYPYSSYASAITTDAAGNAYVAGYAYGYNYFATIKYDVNGGQQWVGSYDIGFGSFAANIALDDSANVFVTGWGYNDGGHQHYHTATVKYNNSGVQQWVIPYNQGLDAAPSALAVDGNRNIYVTGAYNNGSNSDYYTVKYSQCVYPDVPVISASSNPLCVGGSTTLNITNGNLNDAAQWKWYTGSCGGTLVGTGTSLTVSPSATTTYYVRGEGGCVSQATCGSIIVNIIPHQPPSAFSSSAITYPSTTTSWGSVACAYSYRVQVRVHGQQNWQTSATVLAPDTDFVWTIPTTIQSPNTMYDWEVRTNYNANNINSSVYSPIQTFTTCSPLSISKSQGSTNLCPNTSMILTATSGYNSYSWSNNASSQAISVNSPNTYAVTATGNGCLSTANVAITQNCNPPVSQSTTNILGTSAKANWVGFQCGVSYNIRISPHGLNNWTIYSAILGTQYNFTGLSLSTSYDWQIRTNCTSNQSSYSGWSSTQTFTTLTQRIEENFINPVTLNLYPNPANESVNIVFNSDFENLYTIRLTDMTGRIVKTETENSIAGENTHVMNLTGIAKGFYIVELLMGDTFNKVKLMVQ